MFISEGFKGLPMKMEEMDPPHLDDEYEKQVITVYRIKPWNYESKRSLKRTDDAGQVKNRAEKGKVAECIKKNLKRLQLEPQELDVRDTAAGDSSKSKNQPHIDLDEYRK